MILETGVKQPEALALYESLEYHEIPKFGYYADDPSSICLAKVLNRS